MQVEGSGGRGEPCWIILGSCAGWELGPAFQGAPYCLWTMRASWPPGISLLSCRAGERPELCRMSLPEFQQFLLEYQAVRWAGLGLGQGSQLRGLGSSLTGASHGPHLAHPH